MLKLDTKPGIIFSGIVSIGATIAYLAVADDYYYRMGLMLDLGGHISCLQILSSVVLIVGVFEQNYKFFVPWMISTGLFIYLMTYATMVVIQTSDWIFVPTILAPSAVYLSCALYAVKKGFDTMRKNQSEPNMSVIEKKNILSHF
ncbi:uncharacterized protein [Drosophila kikkawai]|uniref:Uncharacterized protein n=1 Tax=Drosophila kikkawai TaxID=30033 RepID=A0A6P4IAJ9_DROKI|nr:uncharacterized protein LOC108076761 [Drosophila kikkawai]